MRAADGKKRLTDVGNTEQFLRIIQSVPSKKAEPFKAWLAMVSRERIEKTIDQNRLSTERLKHISKRVTPGSGYISGCLLSASATS